MSFIPVNEPLLNGNEKKYLNECIDTGWISSEGPFVKKLEDMMASYVGRKYGIAVCNGSAALEVAVEVLKFEKGDEVIMPTFTIISCAAALVRRGIKPVLVDADERTWNMNVDLIEEKITPKTKAIMVVHIYGLPVDMDKVMDIAKRYNLKVIEDAAEAHGLKCNGKMCGSFGDVSIMSFYPNKHVTTGEGGMVLTDNEKLAESSRSYRNLCFRSDRRFVHDELGFNFRMSNIQAAVGVAQLEKIEEHLKIKRAVGLEYHDYFKNFNNIDIPIKDLAYSENLYWVFGIVIKKGFHMTAVEAMKILGDKGIGTRPFFYPMHLQPVFINMGLFKGEQYPVAEFIAEKGFYVPCGLSLSKEQIIEVVDSVKQVLEEQ